MANLAAALGLDLILASHLPLSAPVALVQKAKPKGPVVVSAITYMCDVYLTVDGVAQQDAWILCGEAGKSNADAIKAVEEDIKTQLEDYSRALADNRSKRKHWAKQLDVLLRRPFVVRAPSARVTAELAFQVHWRAQAPEPPERGRVVADSCCARAPSGGGGSRAREARHAAAA